MRPTHLFDGAGCAVPPPPGAGVELPPEGAGAPFEPPGAGAGAGPPPPAKRTVRVRLAFVFLPPARRSASLTVARPFAARSASRPFASKRSLTSVTERFGSFTARVAAVRAPATTVALPRRA